MDRLRRLRLRSSHTAAAASLAFATMTTTANLVGCGADSGTASESGGGGNDVGGSDHELVKTEDAHWVYDGPLDVLQDANVTVSLRGHTARLTGYLATDLDLSMMPNARKTQDGARIRVDIVYPTATGEQASYNAGPGTYAFQDARPYRPDSWVTNSFGRNLVPWGGFPFLNYNSGIALHGPITTIGAKADGNLSVFYLRRGRVSHGCNRLLGEHVTELTHALGVSMRKIYEPSKAYAPPPSHVNVIADFDVLEDKYIDVDYPTDTTDPGNIRPKTAYGPDRITMFGSWIASELPDGSDVPPDMKWEAGERNKYYVFSEHVRKDWVCSIPRRMIGAAAAYAQSKPNEELPRGFCKKKGCVLSALEHGDNADVACP